MALALAHTGVDRAGVNLAWQAFLRRFDIEHTFRMLKQAVGRTTPKLRSAATAPNRSASPSPS